jgi:hypothetical protein
VAVGAVGGYHDLCVCEGKLQHAPSAAYVCKLHSSAHSQPPPGLAYTLPPLFQPPTPSPILHVSHRHRSTSEEVLVQIEHPIAAIVLEYRQLAKLRGGFAEPLMAAAVRKGAYNFVINSDSYD